MLSGLIKLMRPHHWTKNGLVLAPLIFAGEFAHLASINKALVAMLLFNIGASAAYIVNDLKDIERDRLHPVKSRKRPLASGQVTMPQALVLLAVLYVLLGGGYFLQPQVVQLIILYLVINLAYSLVLKHQPVIDLFILSFGFVLRVVTGAVALAVPVSSWMFVTTLCLALYLAAVKRRQELLLNGSNSRKVLEKYTVSLLERYAEMAATGALLFYSLFVITARPELIVTIPLVLFGLFRYWFIVETRDGGESPTDVLLTDWQLMGTVIVWVGVCMWVIGKSMV